MGGGFYETKNVTVTGANGNATGLLEIPFRHGILQQVTVELTTGDATDFGINLYEAKLADAFQTTAANSDLILALASGARTLYNARDYVLKFTAREDTRVGNAGRVMNITVNVGFSGGSAIAQIFKVTVSGIGVS